MTRYNRPIFCSIESVLDQLMSCRQVSAWVVGIENVTILDDMYIQQQREQVTNKTEKLKIREKERIGSVSHVMGSSGAGALLPQ